MTKDLLAQLPIDEREIILKRMAQKGTNLVACWLCGRIMEVKDIRKVQPLCSECERKRFLAERLPLNADDTAKLRILDQGNVRPGKNWKSKYER